MPAEQEPREPTLAVHVDAYPPPEIARRVEALGVTKASGDAITLLLLAVLAGAFISMGAVFYLVAITDPDLGYGPTRLLGGLAFSLGLILVVVAGAELFTGNNLLAMAWASGRIGPRAVLRNWGIVYVGNVVGCLATVALVVAADLSSPHTGAIGHTAIKVASAKLELDAGVAIARGVLCNALVCLAVWLAMGGRGIIDKATAIVFPITAFVALGLEHSIANWFFLPYGFALDANIGSPAAAARNLVFVTVGNVIGGTLLVSAIYWLAYLRGERRS